MVIVAVLVPVAEGSKVILKVVELAAAIGVLGKAVIVKSAALGPDRVVPVMLRLAIPLFSMVMTLFAVFPIT